MDSRIGDIDEQIKRLKQRKAALVAKETQRRRRLDARCKILVGAHLRKLAEEGDAEAPAAYRRVIANLREDERSRKSLDEWGTGVSASAEQEENHDRHDEPC